jgi:hypothetical protein
MRRGEERRERPMNNRTTEWTLVELVDDPLVGLVMKSDGVDRRSIELLFERVARSPRYRERTRSQNC